MDKQADKHTWAGKDERETTLCPKCVGCGETAPWDSDESHDCPECGGGGEVPAGKEQDDA